MKDGITVGFTHKSPGIRSMMRLISLMGTLLGGVVALWGMILMTVVVKAVIEGVNDAGSLLGTLMMVVGGALGTVAGSQGLKVLQQRGEVKENGSV